MLWKIVEFGKHSFLTLWANVQYYICFMSVFALSFWGQFASCLLFGLLIIHLEGKLQCISNDFHNFDIKNKSGNFCSGVAVRSFECIFDMVKLAFRCNFWFLEMHILTFLINFMVLHYFLKGHVWAIWVIGSHHSEIAIFHIFLKVDFCNTSNEILTILKIALQANLHYPKTWVRILHLSEPQHDFEKGRGSIGTLRKLEKA